MDASAICRTLWLLRPAYGHAEYRTTQIERYPRHAQQVGAGMEGRMSVMANGGGVCVDAGHAARTRDWYEVLLESVPSLIKIMRK